MSSMTDLTERLRELNTTDDHARGCQGREYHCSCDYDIRVENAVFEAISALETLTQEVERLRGLLIDPGDPAWEDARAVLVAELRKAGMDTHADNVSAGHALQIPSWVALNLIAHSRKCLTQENARLREALRRVQELSALCIHQNTGRWSTDVEHDVRSSNVLHNIGVTARKALGGD